MNILSKILNLPKEILKSFIRAWKGEERLWIVFWGWGVLGQFVIFMFWALQFFPYLKQIKDIDIIIILFILFSNIIYIYINFVLKMPFLN